MTFLGPEEAEARNTTWTSSFKTQKIVFVDGDHWNPKNAKMNFRTIKQEDYDDEDVKPFWRGNFVIMRDQLLSALHAFPL